MLVRWLVLLVATGCVAMRAPAMSERPRWRFTTVQPTVIAGCAIGDAWIRKSGKQGFGVAIRWRSTADCRVELATVSLAFADGATVTIAPPAPIELHGRSLVYAWLPVRFDNDAAWDDDRNAATLALAIRANGASIPWAMPVVQK